jgi:MGT family glycosyltransferase
MSRIRVLMAAHPTVGHTSALRAIGARLRGQGHEVGIALGVAPLPFRDRWPEPLRAAMQLPEALARDGLALFPLSPALSSLWHAARLPRATGYDELDLAIRLFTAGIGRQALQIAEHARRFGAEVIVGDYLLPAALLGAQLAGRPFAAVYHSALPFPAAGAPPFGSGQLGAGAGGAEQARAEARLEGLRRLFDERIAAAARELGLPEPRRNLLTRPISTELNLLATTPELEPGLLPLEGPVVMTGPCLPKVSQADGDDPALRVLREGSARIYVSLGTVFNGQPRVFGAILDGIGRGEAQVIVSAGASFERLASRAGPSTHIFRRVPQVALLPKVDVVVTHGGNNTVQETLAAGRPMVVIPFGGDQLENARRVERLGVGSAILPAALSAEAVARALEVVRSAPVVARARALGESLAGQDGAGRAATEILALAAKARA